ncbi:Hsp33 family molecular chaperone HslO [Altererythrobacter aquiaggeris]|uniref:Hsp33 family molecular chaperone HslO n=1 Tax=Aestuarierythrobacter aquiaggeris TaxID=1898396 RepID=UPI0030180B1C
MQQLPEILADQLLGFTIPDRNARGRVIRLDGVLDTILSVHDYPPAIKHLLAEALAIAALMGGLLKGENSQLTLQAQTNDGVVELLVCDFRDGELRGYVKHDNDRLAALGANPALDALFGQGHLAVTFDLPSTGRRYQGIVPLEGDSLAAACESYFAQSEQLPTLIRIGVKSGPRGTVAGGLLLQHLAEGEEGRERLHVRLDHPEWEHVATMAGSVRHEELVDPALTLEALVWRLFHEEREVRVEQGARLTRGCRCTLEHFTDVLSRFGKSEREEMHNDDGEIIVDCAFCSRKFRVPG